MHPPRRATTPSVDVGQLSEALSGYPLSLSVLFGSYALGMETELSDLDVAVQFESSVAHDRKLELLDEITVTSLPLVTNFRSFHSRNHRRFAR